MTGDGLVKLLDMSGQIIAGLEQANSEQATLITTLQAENARMRVALSKEDAQGPAETQRPSD